jgi:hypothetical protein
MQGAQNLRSERTCRYAATTKVKRNAADGLFTKPSGLLFSEMELPAREGSSSEGQGNGFPA